MELNLISIVVGIFGFLIIKRTELYKVGELYLSRLLGNDPQIVYTANRHYKFEVIDLKCRYMTFRNKSPENVFGLRFALGLK